MKIGKYETGILGALKDRVLPPGSKHPRRAFWWPADGWITDPDEIVRAIRLDDDMGVNGMVATDPPNQTEPSESAQSVDRSEDKA